mmetsp:Transcript_33997/g.100182  ORF Transcript_33997/g.100182 Transcript_33997/m.100182 type:complete len:106 (-) Transcript_33997:575-892(-)
MNSQSFMVFQVHDANAAPATTQSASIANTGTPMNSSPSVAPGKSMLTFIIVIAASPNPFPKSIVPTASNGNFNGYLFSDSNLSSMARVVSSSAIIHSSGTPSEGR